MWQTSSPQGFNALEILNVEAPYGGEEFTLHGSLFPRLRTLLCRNVGVEDFTNNSAPGLVHVSFREEIPLGILWIHPETPSDRRATIFGPSGLELGPLTI